MLEAALAYAARGWPIFPCNAAKRPYTGNGVLDATTDAKKIAAWWAQYPRANIGLDCAGANFMVLDLDPGHSMEELEKNVGKLPKTELRQRTPRGGEHLFFTLADGEIVAPSASKLAAKVDVRSFHSYVLLAPSRTDMGSYAWEAQGKPAFRSDEMVRVANAAREKHEDRDNWIIQPDLPENVAAAVAWLKADAKIAVEGHGGDSMAYKTAAHLKSFGISQALALDLMWEHWNPRCIPPWSADEIDHLEAKVNNGYSYNTSPPGNITPAYHVAKDLMLFKPIEKKEGEGQTLVAGRFTFYDGVAMHHIKPPTWLVDDFIEERSLSMLFGARGVFKTFIALDIGLTIATGGNFPWDGLWQPTTQGPVLFAAGEGADSLPIRKAAWEHTHWGGKRVTELLMTRSVPRIESEKDLDIFIKGAKAMRSDGYALVVIDTLARSMSGLNENDTSDAMLWATAMATIQEELNAAVLAIHHVGYGEKNQHRARGNPVLEDAPDMLVRIDRADKQSNVVSLNMTKQRNGTEWAKPRFAEVRPVPELNSLAAVAPLPDAVPKSIRDRKPSEELTEDDKTVLQTIDKAIVETLKVFPGKEFSQRQLAEVVVSRGLIDMPSETLRKKPMQFVRENKDSMCRQFNLYDALKARWVWRGPS